MKRESLLVFEIATPESVFGHNAPASGQCPVCDGAAEPVEYICEVEPYVGKRLRGTNCAGCGLMRFPENEASFEEEIADRDGGAFAKVLRESRNAGSDRPGREFHMARMGIQIIVRPDAEVSFFGAGVNKDWQWLHRHYPGVRTKLVDLQNHQRAPHFEEISRATPSDVVVAAEVIEHFSEPVAHFRTLLRLIKPDGLLICSTNVYDGTDIRRHNYPFFAGHVAYWTPLSLLQIAAREGLFVDFRSPKISFGRAGPRKKYVLFYRTQDMAFQVAHYFGTRLFAPSED